MGCSLVEGRVSDILYEAVSLRAAQVTLDTSVREIRWSNEITGTEITGGSVYYLGHTVSAAY